jgi:hypothetical protein
MCRVSKTKKAEEDATFGLIKMATSSRLFYLTNAALFWRILPEDV